ncbi:MAG TPA: metallopeptidase family protein [Bryobacteraceae bacterium]
MPRVTPAEFDRIVERGLGQIDPRFRKRMQNVILVVEPEPPEPGLLGLYQGRPLTERSVSESFALPDRITIFQGPHERMARSLSELEAVVADTVWHEVAHYFGMNERQVERAERVREARRRRASRSG